LNDDNDREAAAAAAAGGAAAGGAKVVTMMESESDDENTRRRNPRRRPQKRRHAEHVAPQATADADLPAELLDIAKDMLSSGNLMLSKAFLSPGSAAKFWYFNVTHWVPPFGKDGSGGLRDALQSALVACAKDGRFSIPHERVNNTHVQQLINMAKNITPRGDIKSAATISEMRLKARKLLVMRGGCLDLSGSEPLLVRPTPRDALFLEDEVMPVDCPATIEDIEKHGSAGLLDFLEGLLRDDWPVFVDIGIVRTLRGAVNKNTAVLHGPRDTFKSILASVLNQAQGDARCPAKVDSKMVGECWASWSVVNPEKTKLQLTFGRTIIRHIDEADDTARTVHLPSIKSEQAPCGTWRLPRADQSVKALVVPFYIISTNVLPDALFTTPLTIDDAQRILVFDTGKNLFAADEAKLTEEDKRLRDRGREWVLAGENNPSDSRLADVSLQLACLVVRWMKDPGLRVLAEHRAPHVTLAAHRSGRRSRRNGRIATLATQREIRQRCVRRRRRRARGQLAIKPLALTRRPPRQLKAWLAANEASFVGLGGKECVLRRESTRKLECRLSIAAGKGAKQPRRWSISSSARGA
jgi:hypothetical protein